eukprot:Skav208998  [mRNA]  locus=scaffold2686:185672:191436:- [translate_table: standard]
MADELPEEHPTMEEAELGGEAELEEGAAEGEEWPEDHGEGEAMEVEHGEAMEGETGEAEGTEAAEAAEAAEGEEHEDGNWWGTEAETAEAEAGEVQAEAETAEADGEAEVHEGHDEGHDEGHEGHEVEGHDGHDGHEAHEGEMEVEAPNPDDPTAPVQMDVGWEAAAWLQEEDGRRLRKLERLSGGEAEVTEEGLLKLVPLSQLAPAGGVGTGHSWCDLCARLLCALRTGEEIELSPGLVELAEAEADIEGLGLFVLEVPGAVEKKAIAGKDGAKLLELCDASDVLAAFTWANESHSESEPVHPKVGDILEGKYGDSYFEVEVIDAPEGGDVKVKWAFDGSESELPVTDLKQKAGGAEIKAGDTVEAKYGDSWHDAEVISVEEDGKVKIKWGFDSSEADLDAADVRGKAEAAEASGDTEHVEVVQADLKEGDKVIQPQTDDGNVKIKWGFDDSEAEVTCKDLRAKGGPPPPPPAKLLVLGKGRPRMALEVRVLNKIESKLPGHVASLQKVSIEGNVGLTVMDLKPGGPGAFSGEQAVDGDRLAVTSMSIGSATLEQDFLKRLGVASNCEILLEDQIAYFASGSSFECARAESFLKPFLTEEGKEAADANKVDDIDGINFILIEREKQTNLPPRVLNDVADKLGVVAFFDDGATLAGVEDNVRLNVICWDVEKQTAALEMLKELQDQEPPPEETWEDDKWNEDQKDDWKNEGQDEWKKDDWSKDDGNKDWKKDDWKKDDGKSNDWKKDDWKNDKKDDWKKDNWQKDDWKKDDGKSNDWKKKDDWKKDEWKKEDDWKSNDKKRKWEEEDKNSWGNDKKSKNDWGGDKSGGWGKEKNEWDKSGGGGGGGGWNQQKSWEKDNDKSGGGGGGGKWGSSEKSWEDKSWKKDTGSDWKDDKKSWDQGKKWGQDQQDNAWKGGGKDDWSNKKDDWNSKDNSKQSAQWEKKDAWGQKKQEKDAWSQKNDSWQQDKGDAWGGSKSWESNGASKAWGQNQGQSKRQWPQDNQDDTKRWRTEATPSSAPRTASTRTAPWQRNAVTNVAAYNSTPKQVLDSLPGGYPDSIDDWKKIQRQVWRNAPQIPNGWIRVWSKKHDCEYYLRLNDNYATFELNEVK